MVSIAFSYLLFEDAEDRFYQLQTVWDISNHLNWNCVSGVDFVMWQVDQKNRLFQNTASTTHPHHSHPDEIHGDSILAELPRRKVQSNEICEMEGENQSSRLMALHCRQQ